MQTSNLRLPNSMVRPLVVIIGETGSGKSALGIDLAKRFNGEIIAADSWTVYKGFNIGTAKPGANQQDGVRHHLLNVADPEVGYSAAEFKRQAVVAIEDITNRSKIPFLVGGTGLYVDSVIYDYSFLAPGSSKLRAELSALTIIELLERIEQKKLDLSNVDIRNKRRLIRLLETEGLSPRRSSLRPNTLILGLTIDRERLDERIVARVKHMFEAGLEASTDGNYLIQ